VSFNVVWLPPARDKVVSFRLPDQVFVEVYLRARDLTDRPAERLIRVRKPFDGMAYHYSVADPDNRLAEYRFRLFVRYAADEQTIVIVGATCLARFGV
jgi:hypothetical protein